MIDYEKTQRGDILEIVPPGAPGHAEIGDLVRVLNLTANGVTVEDRDGKEIEFVYNCGAARLKPTEWKEDFPEIVDKAADCEMSEQEEMPEQEELPEYRCHKKVRALKIAKLFPHDDGTTTMQPAEEGFNPFLLSEKYIKRHKPKEGGYYVLYKNGYESFSPGEAFLDGYTRI